MGPFGFLVSGRGQGPVCLPGPLHTLHSLCHCRGNGLQLFSGVLTFQKESPIPSARGKGKGI